MIVEDLNRILDECKLTCREQIAVNSESSIETLVQMVLDNIQKAENQIQVRFAIWLLVIIYYKMEQEA